MSQNDGETEGRGCRVVRIANTLPGYRRHIVLLAFAGKADINGKPALIEVVIENLKRLAPLVGKHGFHTVIANAAQRSQPSPHHGKCRIASRKELLRHREFRTNGHDIYREIESLRTKTSTKATSKKLTYSVRMISTLNKSQRATAINNSTKTGCLSMTLNPKRMSRQESCKRNATYVSLFN